MTDQQNLLISEYDSDGVKLQDTNTNRYNTTCLQVVQTENMNKGSRWQSGNTHSSHL